MYCISYGSAILNIFNPEAQGGVLVSQQHNYAASRELKSVFAGEDKVSAALRDGNPSLSQPLSPTNPNNNPSNNPPGHPIADIHSSSSGTAAERVYFHLLLVMFCCYTAMILTSWGNTDGSPDSTSTLASKTTGNSNGMTRAEESMWIKITSEWVFLLLYMKVLHAAYIDNL